HRRTAVRRLDPVPLLDLLEDRLRDRVAWAERVGELLAVLVEEDRAVGTRRLGDRIALHVLRPRTAVRVVLQRVEVAGVCADTEGDLGHLARGVGMVGRELAALGGLLEAA